ncbi:MAG: type IV toxin-antitoxin system AbiEi family antitoxin domain-containing protein [Planctomycetota bacterium]|nr:type IV toxin-antitoxin system AbiEi family antitoxin domain-containing protein [Planctomycetota bacterium]
MAKPESPELIFRSGGGQLRMREAIRRGITRHTLYALRDRGVIEQLGRGVYRLAAMPPTSRPDLLTVALRIPKAVICLVSALDFHDLTTQIPHSVEVALPRSAGIPRLAHPPLLIKRFSDAVYAAGVEEHMIDGAAIKIYSPAKTLADCFKYRNKIGMDVVLEALSLYRAKRTPMAGVLAAVTPAA